jgi:hypothetical protein
MFDALSSYRIGESSVICGLLLIQEKEGPEGSGRKNFIKWTQSTMHLNNTKNEELT